MRIIQLVVYSCTLIAFTVFSYAFIDPNLIYLKPYFTDFAFQNRTLATGIYILLLIILTTQYIIFVRQIQKKIITAKNVVVLIGVTIAILLFSYPAMLSYDIFNYIATAKVTFFYRENPYIIMPIEFFGEPMLQFMHAANKTALYGPVWIFLTAIPYIIGNNNFLLTVFAFKLFVLLFYIIAIILVYRLTRNWYAVTVFALNPLVITETLISGHNDIVMMVLALAAFYFLKKKKLITAIVFLILSIGIKFATVFLVPLFIYTALRVMQKKLINWDRVYLWAYVSMLVVFLLSPLREEMYPWYAIWFFTFLCLTIRYKKILFYTTLFMFGLTLRYIPFMYFGMYHSEAVQFRTIIMYIPLILYFFLSKLFKQLKRISLV